VDQAGNFNTLSLIVYLDTVAPDLTVFTPRDELWTNLTKVLVTGATEQGASMLINGQNVNVQNTVFSFYANLVEGPNRIVLTARDAAGNTKTLDRTVYLDTRPPDLILTAPMDGFNTGLRAVIVTGSVDFGCEVWVNGEWMTVTDFVFWTSMRFEEDGPQVIEATRPRYRGP
jgi:hypothetical protein